MKKNNPLRQYQFGVQLTSPSMFVPWGISKHGFLGSFPHDSVTRENEYWVSGNCQLLGLDRNMSFNFVPHPQAVFHEIQFNDRDALALKKQHAYFAKILRFALGKPTHAYRRHLRWHDDTIVIEVDILDVGDTPDGARYPMFQFIFQNSKMYPEHWNNQPERQLGFEQWE